MKNHLLSFLLCAAAASFVFSHTALADPAAEKPKEIVVVGSEPKPQAAKKPKEIVVVGSKVKEVVREAPSTDDGSKLGKVSHRVKPEEPRKTDEKEED